MTRVLTALLLIPVAVGLIFLGPSLAVRAVLALVALLCLREGLNLAEASSLKPFRAAAYAAGFVVVFTPVGADSAFLTGFTVLLLLLSLREPRRSSAMQAAAATLFFVVYICGPFAVARVLHELSPHWMFAVLLINWVGDSSAYYAGRAFGKRKLAPIISPNKTWEGAIASAILGTAVGTSYLLYFEPAGVGPASAAGFAFVAGVAGQFGDLAESALKRGVRVKDSGSLLPGHGGMLDRMDGALFSFPAALAFLLLAGLTSSVGGVE